MKHSENETGLLAGDVDFNVGLYERDVKKTIWALNGLKCEGDTASLRYFDRTTGHRIVINFRKLSEEHEGQI
jgi:hypothetical protein